MIRHLSSRFAHRLADYSYPQLRHERPRVTERETYEEGESDATFGAASKEPEEAAALKG